VDDPKGTQLALKRFWKFWVTLTVVGAIVGFVVFLLAYGGLINGVYGAVAGAFVPDGILILLWRRWGLGKAREKTQARRSSDE
jgi:hypothetical protein